MARRGGNSAKSARRNKPARFGRGNVRGRPVLWWMTPHITTRLTGWNNMRHNAPVVLAGGGDPDPGPAPAHPPTPSETPEPPPTGVPVPDPGQITEPTREAPPGVPPTSPIEVPTPPSTL